MKKLLFIAAVLLLYASTAMAQAPKFGVGVFGGINIPVVQDDQKSGTAFGLKARIKLLPIIIAEPNVTFGKWGDPDPVDGLDLGISGSKITSFGIDFTLGGLPGKAGFKPFAFVGVASYKVKNDDTNYENSKLGVAGGLGFAIGVSPLIDIEVRGKAVVAPQDDGSKKAIWILGGINYYFGGY
ncbi:MAG: outer membrane beta-barrel protein [candidate division Zixibacteria bacterium]|nr:outer membrane beta-barrel protein [candidate division Zixibacteria bacterium]